MVLVVIELVQVVFAAPILERWHIVGRIVRVVVVGEVLLARNEGWHPV